MLDLIDKIIYLTLTYFSLNFFLNYCKIEERKLTDCLHFLKMWFHALGIAGKRKLQARYFHAFHLIKK